MSGTCEFGESCSPDTGACMKPRRWATTRGRRLMLPHSMQRVAIAKAAIFPEQAATRICAAALLAVLFSRGNGSVAFQIQTVSSSRVAYWSQRR